MSLALCVALASTPVVAHAVGVEPGKATPIQIEQARTRFLKGKTLFAQKKYDDALTEFRASLEIVNSPNTHLYVARTLREKGNLVEAYVEFGRTEVAANELSVEDPRYKKAGEAATQERNDLAKRLGFVSLTVKNAGPDTKITIAGEELKRAGWDTPAPVMPGTTEIVLESPGHAPVKKSVTLEAGGKTTLDLDANEGASTEAPPPPPPPPVVETTAKPNNLRTWAYVAGAVGVVGLATFTIAGLKSNSIYNDLKDSCGNNPCPSSKSDDISSGKRWQTIANVGLVIGVIGVATGVTLFVISKPKTEGGTTAQVGVSPTGVFLQGAF
jgi:hypothetical protein